MSFTRVHTAEKTIEGQTLWLGVYVDKSACLFIGDRAFVIYSDELAPKIELSDKIRDWLNTELTKGRAK
jgi:hypothetical protein